MGRGFWIKRSAVVFGGIFVLIGGVHLVKGYTARESLWFSLLWSAIATVLFMVTRIWRARRGEHCALCGDTPEMHKPEG